MTILIHVYKQLPHPNPLGGRGDGLVFTACMYIEISLKS